MPHPFSRTELLLGKAALARLAQCRVAVFGIGGVGGYVVEGLARSGIGAMDLIDHDRVDITNINRQIVATHETIGEYKVDVASDRVSAINPACKVTTYRTFFLPETQDTFSFDTYDYVVDAIDTVTGKLALITCARQAGVPVISSMGAGNKLDPTAFTVADLYETRVCPLARVVRRECRKAGIDRVKVVYSEETPVTHGCAPPPDFPGSVSFVPSVAGLIIAGAVVQDLIAAKGDAQEGECHTENRNICR